MRKRHIYVKENDENWAEIMHNSIDITNIDLETGSIYDSGGTNNPNQKSHS